MIFSGVCSPYAPAASMASGLNVAGALPVPTSSVGGGGSRRRSSSIEIMISPSAAARSLLSKLNIRKPSILSISSNASSPGCGGGGDRRNSSQEDFFNRGAFDSVLFNHIVYRWNYTSKLLKKEVRN
jgi:hypothetical protein